MGNQIDKKKIEQIITQQHYAFFRKYGFIVLRGLHNKKQIQIAKQAAQDLIQQHKKAKDGGKGQQAFGKLPQGSRSSWGRCTQKRLMDFFDFKLNRDLCQKVVGPHQFKHHEGPGFYTFAPRFYDWHQNPVVGTKQQEKLQEPYDPNNIPQDFSQFSSKFIKKASNLGMSFTKVNQPNWHIDGLDYNGTMQFNVLWGSYINSLPKGNMGNLIVYPGTHHVIAKMMKQKGPFFSYDGKKQKPKPLPQLKKQGLHDGRCFQVCVQAGDILFAHPWLAHGIGQNLSQQTRLAVYCRLSAKDFHWPTDTCGRSKMAGQKAGWDNKLKKLIEPKKWKGDYWDNVPPINKWFKQNEKILDQYDNGALKQALHK